MARTKRAARKQSGSLKRRRDEDDVDQRSPKKANYSQPTTEEQSDDKVDLTSPAFLANQFAKSIQKQAPESDFPEMKVDAKEESTEKTSKPRRAEQTESDDVIAKMNPSLLADHFAKSTRKSFPDSSPIELEDLYLPTKAFKKASDFDEPRLAHNMPGFLEKTTENGKAGLVHLEAGKGPHTLVITSAGIRTADLARVLRVFNSEESQVAKLIAKHMKLKENIKHMKKNPVGIAISTPMRLRDLIDADALNLDDVKRIVVDGSYQDEKRRSIFEIKEVFRPLVELLSRAELKQRYGSDAPVEIVVF